MITRFAVISVGAVAATLWLGLAVLLGLQGFLPGETQLPAAGPQISEPLPAAPAVPAVVFRSADPAIAELLGRSPFDEARRQFVRAAVNAPPPPPPEPPRILGIASSDGKRSALVEWKATGETQRLTVGMETPLGVVDRIGESDLTLKVGETEATISMFD
jgi:hypothetical protein